MKSNPEEQWQETIKLIEARELGIYLLNKASELNGNFKKLNIWTQANANDEFRVEGILEGITLRQLFLDSCLKYVSGDLTPHFTLNLKVPKETLCIKATEQSEKYKAEDIRLEEVNQQNMLEYDKKKEEVTSSEIYKRLKDMKSNVSEIFEIVILPEYSDIFNPTFDTYDLEQDIEDKLDDELKRLLPKFNKVKNTLDDGSFRFITKRYIEDIDEIKPIVLPIDKICASCKYYENLMSDIPCNTCNRVHNNWEAKDE